MRLQPLHTSVPRWVSGLVIAAFLSGDMTMGQEKDMHIELPSPREDSQVSVERAIRERRCAREFRDDPVTLAEAGQLLWAAQGITGKRDHRSAPSAGALYPLEVYLVAGVVQGLEPGAYKYHPRKHHLTRSAKGDIRSALGKAALEQAWVSEAPAVIVFSAVYPRTMKKYGERGLRYVHIEVGHAAENAFLQAVALGLQAVVVGAFDDAKVQELLVMPNEEKALYIMPIGHAEKPRE